MSLHTHLRMRLIHFRYEIFLIWTSFCPTFTYYFDETLNPVANSSRMPFAHWMPEQRVRKPICANCKGPHVASYKGCPEYKKQALRQHVVSNQKSYASTVSQNTLLQPKPIQTFTFTAEQLTRLVTNVVIKIAQPQVCYPNPKQDTLDLKSSMCRKVLEISTRNWNLSDAPIKTPLVLCSKISKIY